MREQYDDMAEVFSRQGLDLQAIHRVRQMLEQQDGSLVPTGLPRQSAHLGNNAERFVVVPLSAASELIKLGASAISSSITSMLPAVFYTSRLQDARPNPMDASQKVTDVNWQDALVPKDDALKLEQETLQTVLGRCSSPRFEVHRVLLADSGTVLICLLDTEGTLGKLRQDLKQAFPNCAVRQPNIAHISVLRLFARTHMDAELRQKLAGICDHFTEQLKGLTVTATELWYIQKAPVIFNANVLGEIEVFKMATSV